MELAATIASVLFALASGSAILANIHLPAHRVNRMDHYIETGQRRSGELTVGASSRLLSNVGQLAARAPGAQQRLVASIERPYTRTGLCPNVLIAAGAADRVRSGVGAHTWQELLESNHSAGYLAAASPLR